MGKLLRIAAYSLAALVLLIVVAAIVIPLVVDPNDYKDDIAAAVEAKTGRQLVMDGDLGLSVFPWLALDIGPTRLANAPGFSDRPFAAVKQVSVRIKLLPLLRRQIEMDTVILDGLQVSLETRADGSTNWADLAGGAKETRPEPERAPDSELALAGLAIGGVKISDANVVWDDRQKKARYEIAGLSLRTGAITPGATVPVELGMQVDASQPPVKGPVTFDGKVSLSDDSQTIRLAQAELKTDLSGEGVPGGALQSRLGFDATVNLASGGLDVPKLVVELLGLTVEATLQGKQLFDAPAINADVTVKPFDPRQVLKALGQPVPEVADAAVLKKADATLKLAATADSAKVSDLRLRLDESSVDGSASVSNFAKPAIRFALHLDQIDIDRYLPAPSADAVETLRALDIDGSMKIDQLQAYQLRSSQILLKLTAKDGALRVNPAQATLYEGKYNGDFSLDVRQKQPKIALNDKLTGVQVGPLLKDLTGKDTLSGTTQASTSLTASGQTPDALKQSLNGTLGFAFTDGSVKGFNLAGMIRRAQAQISGQPAPAEAGPNQTDFSELTGTGTVTNGVISNRDLMAKSPLLRVEGAGDVNLPKETLDYLLTAKVVGSLEGQGGKGVTELKGVAVPVQISGTFAEPKYQVRLDKALRDSAEEKIKEKVEKKLEKKFGDKLKGLFP
jgi:AsmA protein